MATVETPGVLGTFHGSEEFPIDWQEGERELFWIYDDLHCPNPVSPLFFDIGGWWLTCDHMFRRFGTPFASRLDRQERSTATSTRRRSRPTRRCAPRRPSTRPATSRASRATASTPARSARTSASSSPTTPTTSSTGGRTACARRSSATSPTSTASDWDAASLRRAGGPARGRDRRPRPPLEDPLDAQLRPVLGHDGPERRGRGGARRGRPGAARPPAVARSRTATGTRSRTSGR